MTPPHNTFTYWSLLGLNPGSDSAQLKEAFIREAKIWHPDLNINNRNAEERFKWINEAYLVLSDPRRRFEWEVAGRPTFEIQARKHQPQESRLSSSQNDHINSSSNFSSGEKILILIITSILIFLVDYYIL